MARIKITEPKVDPASYPSSLSNALYWYHQEKDKKDARAYLRDYVNHNYSKQEAKKFDKVPDSKIVNTYAWISRMILNGAVTLREKEQVKFNTYITELFYDADEQPDVVEEEEVKVARPSVRDNMEEKVKEYLGELEGFIDELVTSDTSFKLYNDLKSRTIPQPYCPYVEAWIKRKAAEFIFVYESEDKEVKEAYRMGKRKTAQIIKTLNEWLEDLERYAQFKKANRKPRVKKVKPAGIQVAKLKYKREDTELGLKSVPATDIVGASQVWVYNTKYKKLAVYRTDNVQGMQVKGSTLQGYEPEQCEQKTLRKPAETIKAVLNAGKVQLRRIIPELTTKESPVNGRINEECIILRVIK